MNRRMIPSEKHSSSSEGVAGRGCVDRTGESERISRVIFSYAARIGQERDLNALLLLNADMGRDLLGAERCSIWLMDAEAGELYTTVAHGVNEIRVTLGHGLVGACITRSEPILVNDTSSDDRFLNQVDQTSGYATHSALVIPLRAADGKVIGAFQALNKPGGFSPSDVVLLGLAGSYSAAAIENRRLTNEAEMARMFLRELAIARDVQAALLPQNTPELEGVECATFFRPAKFVGGDYYDFVKTPNGALAFTLGDVSGKGVPAAVFMASIQGSLRIQLAQGHEHLARVVADLNMSIHASSSSNHYSTLFCGLLDPQSGRLVYVNAGQCSPMLARFGPDGLRVDRLTTGGPPPGLLPFADYQEGSTMLQKNDVLLCFSDGISEACNPQEELWQEADIARLVGSAAGWTAHEITERIVQAADAFMADAEQADDMTMLTLRAI